MHSLLWQRGPGPLQPLAVVLTGAGGAACQLKPVPCFSVIQPKCWLMLVFLQIGVGVRKAKLFLALGEGGAAWSLQCAVRRGAKQAPQEAGGDLGVALGELIQGLKRGNWK